MTATDCVGTLDRTLIQFWRGVATLDAMTEMNRIAARLIDADPFPATSLFITWRHRRRPPSPSRGSSSAKFSNEAVGRMKFAVVVAEGSGFRAAIVRGAGLTLHDPQPVPLELQVRGRRAGRRLPCSSRHLPPRTGGAKWLLDAAEALRRKLDAQVYRPADSTPPPSVVTESSRRRP